MTDSSNGIMYAVQDVSGKGTGLIATRKITKGTRILSEAPLLTMPPLGNIESLSKEDRRLLRQTIDHLAQDKRDAFFALHNAFPDGTDSEYIGRIQTNALELDFLPTVANYEPPNYGSDSDSEEESDEDEEESDEDEEDSDDDEDKVDMGIFQDASRINHSCENNAHNNWNEKIKRYTVQALRDIEKGEEITINYISYTACFHTREERQNKLRKRYAFECRCGLCTLPQIESEERDSTVLELREGKEEALKGLEDTLFALDGDDAFEDAFEDEFSGSADSDDDPDWEDDVPTKRPHPMEALEEIEHIVCIYNASGFLTALPEAYDMAAELCLAHGDQARGRVFHERAANGWSAMEGEDSPNVMRSRALAHSPRGETPPVSTDWMTRVDEIPSGLDTDAFEDWLWRRNVDVPNEQADSGKGKAADKGKSADK